MNEGKIARDVSSETIATRQQGIIDHLLSWKERSSQSRILYLAKRSFKNGGKIKTFTDKPDRIHHQQTFTTRNSKGRLQAKEMMANENWGHQREIQRQQVSLWINNGNRLTSFLWKITGCLKHTRRQCMMGFRHTHLCEMCDKAAEVMGKGKESTLLSGSCSWTCIILLQGRMWQIKNVYAINNKQTKSTKMYS